MEGSNAWGKEWFPALPTPFKPEGMPCSGERFARGWASRGPVVAIEASRNHYSCQSCRPYVHHAFWGARATIRRHSPGAMALVKGELALSREAKTTTTPLKPISGRTGFQILRLSWCTVFRWVGMIAKSKTLSRYHRMTSAPRG